jgi:ABC-type nitrate/sulfonate/bicarbonate transport system substrate-binding protein
MKSVTGRARRRPIRTLATMAVGVGLIASMAACGSSNSSGGTTSSAIPSSECAANKAAGPVNYISPFGFDASATIIDVFVAEKLGYFSKMCLTTDINTTATDPTELLSSGRAEVSGYGSAADAIVASSGQSDIVTVATWANTSDYALITNKSITSLKQLEGQTLAYYTALPVVIQAMLAKAGVDVSKVKLVATTNYDPTQVTRGVVAALQGYQSDQVLELKAEGLQFNTFTPQQYGVKGTYNTMSWNGAFLKNHKQTVADWMRADLKAAAYCLDHETQCVDIEHQYAVAADAATAFPLAHEMQVWQEEASLIKQYRPSGVGLGTETYAQWQPELSMVKQYHAASDPPTLQRVENTTLIPTLYHGTTLIWP